MCARSMQRRRRRDEGSSLFDAMTLCEDMRKCLTAAEAGDLDELKRLRGGRAWSIMGEHTIEWAAKCGQMESLKFAHENGCPWHVRVCRYTAGAGHLECLKFARENGCPWDATTCATAASWGRLECLKYAHENGCPWDEDTCTRAAWDGHLECLKYAHENGCPIDVAELRRYYCDPPRSHRRNRNVRAYLESLIKCPYESAMAALDEAKDVMTMTDGDYKTIADALMLAHRAKRRRE